MADKGTERLYICLVYVQASKTIAGFKSASAGMEDKSARRG
jgi:hypothetical protein